MPLTNSKNYGTANFEQPMVAVGSKKLDEEAETAREKRDRGEELTWREEWLLK